jgi:uncharacterized membrane protein YphA (DoxX/SURF4 family)
MFLTFPELLDFSLLAAFALRISAGYFFLLLGFRTVHALRITGNQGPTARAYGLLISIARTVVGAFLIAGFLTQPAALAGIVLSVLYAGSGTTWHGSLNDRHVAYLLGVICFALLFLGPGLFSFDLNL